MPGGDLDRHHDQLIEYEHGERNCDHLVEVGESDQELRNALDDAPLIDGDSDPDEKRTIAETAAGRELLV